MVRYYVNVYQVRVKFVVGCKFAYYPSMLKIGILVEFRVLIKVKIFDLKVFILARVAELFLLVKIFAQKLYYH